VCLGLLPTSEGSWNTGLKALRPEGGFLHVHNNVKDVEEASWIDYLVSSLKTMSSVLGEYMSYLCHSKEEVVALNKFTDN
jgi:tRNA wybutosine-synthesizing protein 3